MSQIAITDAGPIEGTFSIDLSKGPGVYEFRGARGTGKTTCISSIDWLAGHRVDVTLHDGAISGKVEGFGVVAPIGGRKRRKGEFDLDTIDAEKFSLTDILDPQGKTPEVRDATRIKAIASLSEVKADPKLYYDLTGGQIAFESMGIVPTDDPVTLATRVKAAFDKRAREKQLTAEAEAQHAVPLEHVPDDLDITGESDLTVLANARDEARDEFQGMKADRENGMKAEQEAKSAQAKLAALKEQYRGPSVEQARQAHHELANKVAAAEAEVERIKAELELAKAALQQADSERRVAQERITTAEQHDEAVSALQETASLTPAYCSEADIAEASRAVEEATAAYNRGVRIRDIRQNHTKAQAHREAEKAAIKASDEAKNKAGQVFDLLAQSLKTKYLRIQSVDGNPRLFVQHPKRGRTAFDSVNGLSDGERVDFALRELLPHIESPGLLPIPQRVWQDLQPKDRADLHKLAVEKGLYLFGAQVDDGELRVEFYGD